MNRRLFISGAVTAGASWACSSRETANPPAANASAASSPAAAGGSAPAALAKKVVKLSFEVTGLSAAATWATKPRLDVLLLDGKAGGIDEHAPALMVKLDDIESYSFLPAEDPSVVTLGGQDFAYWSLMDRVVTVNGFDDPSKADITFPATASEQTKTKPDNVDDPAKWADRHWLVPLHEICKASYAPIKDGKYIASRVRLFNGQAQCIRPKLKSERRRLFAFTADAKPPFQQYYSTGFRIDQQIKDVDNVTLSFHTVLAREPETLGATAGTVTLRPATGDSVVVSISNFSLGHHPHKNHFGIYYDLTGLTAQKPKNMCYSEDGGTSWTCDDGSDKPGTLAPYPKPDAPSPFCIPPNLPQP